MLVSSFKWGIPRSLAGIQVSLGFVGPYLEDYSAYIDLSMVKYSDTWLGRLSMFWFHQQ